MSQVSKVGLDDVRSLFAITYENGVSALRFAVFISIVNRGKEKMSCSTLFKLATVVSLLACLVATTSQAAENQVSLTFVRSILNAPPNLVQEKLGKPDNGVKTTNDCFDAKMQKCDFATYEKGKFEVAFYKGRLKSILIYGNDFFNQNAPELIGFPNAPPTWANQFTHSWRSAANKGTASGPLIPVDGIDEISVFHGYMIISVGVSYNKSFTR